MASKSEVLRRAPVCVRKDIPLGARASRPHLIPANSLPSAPLPCQAHRTRLYGDLFHRAGVCAGGTPALPGGLSSRAVLPPPREWSEKSLQCTRSAMEADGRFVHQQRSDASLIPGFHTNGKLCFRNESPTLTAYLGWTSPWERGRPARTLFLQTACHPRPLPCKAH